MSTILNTNGSMLEVPAPYDPDRFVCDIVTAEWNPDVTHALRDGAVATLVEATVQTDQQCKYRHVGAGYYRR